MKKFLISAVALGVLFTATAATATSLALKEFHKDWESYRACEGARCIWRATVRDPAKPQILALDFSDSGSYGIFMILGEIPKAEMDSWSGTTDIADGEVRVDRKKIRKVEIFKILDRNARIITYSLPVETLGPEFIKELYAGNTLRVRVKENGSYIISSFSLRGATAAISRALHASLKIKNSNSYFENENNNEDSTYFENSRN